MLAAQTTLGSYQVKYSLYNGPESADAERRIRRAAHGMKLVQDWTKGNESGINGKNILLVTMKGDFGEYAGKNITKKTLVFQSAGLGGAFPLDGERKVSHTEEMAIALLNNPRYQAARSVEFLFSSNQLCNSSPARHDGGCASIPRSDLLMSDATPVFYGVEYATGEANSNNYTANKMIRDTSDGKLVSTASYKPEVDFNSDSEDEHLDSDAFRARNLRDEGVVKSGVRLEMGKNKFEFHFDGIPAQNQQMHD